MVSIPACHAGDPLQYSFRSNNISNVVRMAERSKAPDLSSGTRMCAWVRTPLLTSFCQILNSPAGIRTPDLWIRNPTRYPLRYKGLVRIFKHQDTNYANRYHPLSTTEKMSLVCMFQWRNRLARGTYTVVHVINDEVVSSSLT